MAVVIVAWAGKCKFKANTNTYQCNLKVFKLKKSTWCWVPNTRRFYKLDSRRWRKSSLMLSESSYVTYRVLQTEKVTGLKIKLIPNPSCWLYFGRKWFSHWRQNWIFIMGFEMDPKSSELHIWSKNMVTIKFLLNALGLSSSLCWALNGVFSCNDPTCENKSANEAKAAAHSTETWGGD